MSHQETNYESPEEELEPSSKKFDIPQWLKWATSAGSVALIVFCVAYTNRYMASLQEYASPNELGLSSIFLFSISVLLLVWIPWSKLGIRISKIGG
jgi:hypothetical protein